MSELLVVLGTLGASMGFLIGPLFMWLGWDGVKIKLWKLKMRTGRFQASLYCDKSNNLMLMFKKYDGSSVKINDGRYVSTPAANHTYKYMGLPVRIRLQGNPADLDLWTYPRYFSMTAKELDNVVNEARAQGLAEILKQYLPFAIMGVIIFAVLAIASLYLAYLNYDVLNTIAPDIMKFIPEGFKLK